MKFSKFKMLKTNEKNKLSLLYQTFLEYLYPYTKYIHILLTEINA